LNPFLPWQKQRLNGHHKCVDGDGAADVTGERVIRPLLEFDLAMQRQRAEEEETRPQFSIERMLTKSVSKKRIYSDYFY